MKSRWYVRFWKGRLTRREVSLYFAPIAAAVIALGLAGALANDPRVFSFEKITLSSLGDYEKNPAPGNLYMAGMVISIGLILMPFAAYVHLRARLIHSRVARQFRGLTRAGAWAWIVAGLFPNVRSLRMLPWLDSDKLHTFMMHAAIILLGLASIAMLRVCRSAMKRADRAGLPVRAIVAVTVPMYVAMGGIIVCETINPLRGSRLGWGLWAFPIWEWALFATGLVWLFGLLLLTPGKVPLGGEPAGAYKGAAYQEPPDCPVVHDRESGTSSHSPSRRAES